MSLARQPKAMQVRQRKSRTSDGKRSLFGIGTKTCGLGGVSAKIKKIIEKIQTPVNKVIDLVIDKVLAGVDWLEKAKSAFGGKDDEVQEANVRKRMKRQNNCMKSVHLKLKAEGNLSGVDKEKVDKDGKPSSDPQMHREPLLCLPTEQPHMLSKISPKKVQAENFPSLSRY